MNEGWKWHVQLKQLFADSEETPEAVNATMKAVATAMRESLAFRLIDRRILQEMDKCTHVAVADGLLNTMYDYADEHRIWIE